MLYLLFGEELALQKCVHFMKILTVMFINP